MGTPAFLMPQKPLFDSIWTWHSWECWVLELLGLQHNWPPWAPLRVSVWPQWGDRTVTLWPQFQLGNGIRFWRKQYLHFADVLRYWSFFGRSNMCMLSCIWWPDSSPIKDMNYNLNNWISRWIYLLFLTIPSLFPLLLWFECLRKFHLLPVLIMKRRK